MVVDKNFGNSVVIDLPTGLLVTLLVVTVSVVTVGAVVDVGSVPGAEWAPAMAKTSAVKDELTELCVGPNKSRLGGPG